MPISVIDNGLVLRDNFNRTDGAPGAPWEDLAVDQSEIVSNRLKVPIVEVEGTNGVAGTDGIAGRLTLFTQVTALQQEAGFDPILAHLSSAGYGYGGDFDADNFSSLYNVFDYEPDLDAILDFEAAAFTVDTDYTLQLLTANGVQKFFSTKDAGELSLSATDTTHDGVNKYVTLLRFNNGESASAALFDNVICGKSNIVSVAGMTTGYTAQLLGSGDVVIAEAVETGGVASIAVGRHVDDGCTQDVPYDGWTKIRILDDEEVEVETITADAAFWPGASLTLEEVPPDPLSVVITNPEDEALILLGSAGDFEGEAISPVDGDISANIVWTSDIDGSLGTGATVPLAGLTTLGRHVITASIEDSEEETAEDEITVDVYDLQDADELGDCFDDEGPIDPEKWTTTNLNVEGFPAADVEGGLLWIRHRAIDIVGTGAATSVSYYDYTAAGSHILVGIGPQFLASYEEVTSDRDLRLSWSASAPLAIARTILFVQWLNVPTAGRGVQLNWVTIDGAGSTIDFGNSGVLDIDFEEFPYWDLIHDGAGEWTLKYSDIGYDGWETAASITPDTGVTPEFVQVSLSGTADNLEGNDHSFTGVNCLLPPTALFDLFASPSLAFTSDLSFANEPGATIVAWAWAYWLADAPETILGTSTEQSPTFELDPFVPGILTFRLIVTDSNALVSEPYFQSSIFGRGDGGDDMAPSEPCILDWTLYLEDGVTIRAQSSSSSNWLGQTSLAKPYLREPSGYGEQEVDFTAGTASLASVNVRHVDVPTIAGDQQSGWFTELVPHVPGNRNRLRRYTAQGWVTIADGPGSFPQLSETFAGFVHEIRDTREKERRLKAFVSIFGLSAIPRGVIDGFGAYGGGEWVSEPTDPVEAEYEEFGFLDYRQHWPGEDPESEAPDFLVIDGLAITAGTPTEVVNIGLYPLGETLAPKFRRTFGNMRWRWREVGDLEWRYTAAPVYESFDTPIATIFDYTGTANANGLFRTITGALFLREDGTEVPHETQVEVYLEYRGIPTEDFPLHIEGLTAGEFLTLLYEGVYSPRDAVTGAIVPTGIRYDSAALALMTAPVRLRITEPVKNIREWAEKNIYLPLGYAPALDNDGLISPVSQEIPNDAAVLNALTVIDNAITQGVPGHAPGDNVINILSFKYPRVYADADIEETEEAPAYTGSTAVDRLSIQDVERVEIDPYSIDRFGEQGDPEIETAALVTLGVGVWTAANELRGVDSVEDQEEGATQFFQRVQNLFLRRLLGTDLVVVPVMRAYTYQLRVGDWVRCRLTWIPNLDTGRRAVDHLSQILAINELNCAWREMTMELVRDFESAFDAYDSDYGLDEYGNFDPAFLQFSITPQAPEDGSEFLTVHAQSNVAPEDWTWRLLMRKTTDLIGGGDSEPFPETDITTALSPPAAFLPLPLEPGTTYEFATGLQRNDATPTRHVVMDFRFQVLNQNGQVVIDSEDYPFPTEWDYGFAE